MDPTNKRWAWLRKNTQEMPYARVAMRKLKEQEPDLPDNFEFYEFETMGHDGMKCTGCEFRPLTRGKNKGDPTPIKGTDRVVVVVKAEVDSESK